MMLTRDAVQTVIAMVRTASNGDSQGFEVLMPDTKEDAQRVLTMAIAVLDAVTTGPRQNAVLNQMTELAEAFGNDEMPRTDDETNGEEPEP